MSRLDNTYFASDHHFRHNNIIKYCNRPFTSVEEMNEAMVKNHNEIVKPTDIVFLLGDLGWPDPSEYIKRLNGDKILITGNHDDRGLLSKLRRENIISTQFDYFELDAKEYGWPKIVMSHYPIESWNRKYHGSIHLHGHTHGTLDNSGLMRFDMGVDCNDYRPFSLRQVLDTAKTRFDELGGKEGIRGNVGDKETFGLKEQATRVVRDSKMQELYNTAEADVDLFLAEHVKYKGFYDLHFGKV